MPMVSRPHGRGRARGAWRRGLGGRAHRRRRSREERSADERRRLGRARCARGPGSIGPEGSGRVSGSRRRRLGTTRNQLNPSNPGRTPGPRDTPQVSLSKPQDTFTIWYMEHDPPPQIADALAAYFASASTDQEHPADCRWQTLSDLSKAVQHLEILQEDIGSLVRHAHNDHDVPWAELARALGVTRQAARQRYGS